MAGLTKCKASLEGRWSTHNLILYHGLGPDLSLNLLQIRDQKMTYRIMRTFRETRNKWVFKVLFLYKTLAFSMK